MFIILSLVIDVNQFPVVAIMRVVIFLKTFKTEVLQQKSETNLCSLEAKFHMLYHVH